MQISLRLAPPALTDSRPPSESGGAATSPSKSRRQSRNPSNSVPTFLLFSPPFLRITRRSVRVARSTSRRCATAHSRRCTSYAMPRARTWTRLSSRKTSSRASTTCLSSIGRTHTPTRGSPTWRTICTTTAGVLRVITNAVRGADKERRNYLRIESDERGELHSSRRKVPGFSILLP